MSQAGHIVRPHGRLKSWGIIYRDPDGRQRWEGKFRTRSEAQRRLTEVLATIDKGTFVKPTAATFEQFAQGWLEARRKLRGSTESAYASLVAKQLVPRIGNTIVSDLRFKHIDAAVSGMIEDELSPKTIRNAVTLLRSMLTGASGPSAKEQGILHLDPTRGLELPPLEHRVPVPLDPESVWRLVDAAKGTGWYPLAYLGAFTGVRRGEILGLRFQDVLWFDNEIFIQNAISKRQATDGVHKWEWWLGPPKSRKSVRRIAGTDSVMKLLAELKAGRAETEFVFGGAQFIDPDVFDEDIWRPIAERAGLPELRFHDLRHFFASQLIAQGETPAYVRDQMGHSSIKVTFDVYGHLFKGAGAAASAKFEKAMTAARKPKEVARPEKEIQQ